MIRSGIPAVASSGPSGAIVVASDGDGCPYGAEPPPLYDGEIVDTHLHLWDLDLGSGPPGSSQATGRAKGRPGPRLQTLADFAEAARRA